MSEGLQRSSIYGGQAVIEGVGMRGPRHVSLSVRAPNGDIVSEVKEIRLSGRRSSVLQLPVLRGVFAFWDSISLGVEMLWKSAEIAMPEEETSEKGTGLAVIAGIGLAVGLFIVLPALIASAILGTMSPEIAGSRVIVSLVETVIRLIILVIYVKAISRMREIQRVLEYHGAEHKVIWAWERKGQLQGPAQDDFSREPDREALTRFLAGEAKDQPRLHPRCGTSLLFLVALVGWVLFIFISPRGVFMRIVARLLTLPLLAGLSYETLRASAERDGPFWRVIRAPGMMLQSMTTREPDSEQLVVAADSLARLIEAERGEVL